MRTGIQIVGLSDTGTKAGTCHDMPLVAKARYISRGDTVQSWLR
jgi:hypothetical protein